MQMSNLPRVQSAYGNDLRFVLARVISEVEVEASKNAGKSIEANYLTNLLASATATLSTLRAETNAAAPTAAGQFVTGNKAIRVTFSRMMARETLLSPLLAYAAAPADVKFTGEVKIISPTVVEYPLSEAAVASATGFDLTQVTGSYRPVSLAGTAFGGATVAVAAAA